MNHRRVHPTHHRILNHRHYRILRGRGRHRNRRLRHHHRHVLILLTLLPLQQPQQLIRRRNDHCPDPTVGGTPFRRLIRRHHHIFTMPRSRQPARGDIIVILQRPDDGRRAFDAEVPVVEQYVLGIGDTVGIPFDDTADLGVVVQHPRQPAHGLFGLFAEDIAVAVAAEQQLVGKVDIDEPAQHPYMDIVPKAAHGRLQLDQHRQIRRIAPRDRHLQCLEIVVLGVDIVYRLLYTFGLCAGDRGEGLQLFFQLRVVLLRDGQHQIEIAHFGLDIDLLFLQLSVVVLAGLERAHRPGV